MKTKRQGRHASARALLVALALLCGALAAPVTLAAGSSADVCTMACCVEEGHCCCKPRRARVEGQTTDGNPHVAATEVAAPCPAGCGAPSSSSFFLKRLALRPGDHSLESDATSHAHSPLSAGKSLAATGAAAAPRAPPAGLIHSAF